MAVTSWPWQHCTPLTHRHPGIVRKPTFTRSAGSSEVVARWLVIYVWTERTVYQWPVPSYQLRAHMKFNQIPSASLHNSDLLIMHSSSRPENNTNQPWPAVPSLPWWWWKTELRHPSVIVQPEYPPSRWHWRIRLVTPQVHITSVGMF